MMWLMMCWREKKKPFFFFFFFLLGFFLYAASQTFRFGYGNIQDEHRVESCWLRCISTFLFFLLFFFFGFEHRYPTDMVY